MFRRRKGFAPSLGDSFSGIELDSSVGSSSIFVSNSIDIMTRFENKKQFDEELSRFIYNSIKSFYISQCTCMSNLAKEELQLWQRAVELRFQYQYICYAFYMFSNYIKEGNTSTPSTLFMRGHRKGDAESGKVFMDDRCKALGYCKKNMRHLELSMVLKIGHKRQRCSIMRFQVDGVRNPPFVVRVLVLPCFITNKLLLPPSLFYILSLGIF
ncbi:LOW QUALITY PROTEIN: hypothetical protein Cgig2_008305 [Carnegiea gigantea]|uniref:Uncharacterized protein n=1 Tax=Carnegiea gigantea TaxID=171969 RepID=A0A9Q1JT87_9CARY|nr:LOW QUALITY PROTEIN: hypothetical protein Cgig2_008305 [Carnegiea gigantea]